MASPVFAAKGTANQAIFNACANNANPNPVYPTLSANDMIILAVEASCSAGSADVINIPAGFNILDEAGAGTTRMTGVYYKIASGSESGTTEANITVNFTSPTAGRAFAQFYQVTGNLTSSPIDGSTTTATGTGTSVNMPTVVCNQTDELAFCVIHSSANTTIGASTGETGGDWTEPFAEDGATSGMIDAQAATMASGGTITGGVATAGLTTTFRSVGFAIKGTPSPIGKIRGRSQAIKRASYR